METPLNTDHMQLFLTVLAAGSFTRAILDARSETEAALKGRAGDPRRRLRITCGYEFGLPAVNGWVRAFLDRWPDVSVEMDLTNRVADNVHEGFDLAIRISPLPDSDLVARCLGQITHGFYAAPGFLAARGTPAHPSDLRARGSWALLVSPTR
ncbi:MAG: LysR substrate-binding domain-containing protein [Gemmobacter sp.]|uniref:LysR substrate-binding domain-containing protein n=1 Tax=Gemmobacter sp. TaxID=1898957 RepID=UPI00391A6155